MLDAQTACGYYRDMAERITQAVVDIAVEQVRIIMTCYGLAGGRLPGALEPVLEGKRLATGHNVVKFNGRLTVTATYPNGYRMHFWAHDTAGLLRDAVDQCWRQEYQRWLDDPGLVVSKRASGGEPRA